MYENGERPRDDPVEHGPGDEHGGSSVEQPMRRENWDSTGAIGNGEVSITGDDMS